ncbi:MAG: TIGR02186 family protein [Hyphomicrobiaceae bacterium]
MWRRAQGWRRLRLGTIACVTAAAIGFASIVGGDPVPADARPVAQAQLPAPASQADEETALEPIAAELPPETVEADVSTRRVAVTSSFSGVELVVFGSIDGARADIATSGRYDVVVVVQGSTVPLIIRRKSSVAGLWLNTDAAVFERVPSFYAVASTRPLTEIADLSTRQVFSIGFASLELRPDERTAAMPPNELRAFKEAVVRLKGREKLYVREDFGVTFVGRNLFRTTIDLPANVPVGTLEAQVHLFRDGVHVDTFATRVGLAREGIERYLHGFAYNRPLLYGVFTVLLAVAMGLFASAIVQRLKS